MTANDEVPMDYRAVLDDLQQQLRAGQARFEAWERDRDQLLKAIEGIKPLAARQTGGQLAMPGFPASPAASVAELPRFRGLTYKDAARKIFQMSPEPISAPEIADILYKAGYASSRRLIKSNIDGIFKRLRESHEIERVGQTPAYRLVETSGAHA